MFNLLDRNSQLAPHGLIEKSHKSGSSSSKGFAVVDTETTGVFIHKDRVVEIAIITFDENGIVERKYSTLVNPHRDLGAINIHGIDASDASLAPDFANIAGEVAYLLAGRAVIGHNIRFDLNILESEFERLNLKFPDIPHICTRSLASRADLFSGRLQDICDELNIDPGLSHNALCDAEATKRVFDALMKRPNVREYVMHQLDLDRPPLKFEDYPALKRSECVFNRRSIAERQPHYLKNLLADLPEEGSEDYTEYYGLLESALEDRRVSLSECSDLARLAAKFRLSKTAAVKAHMQYIRRLLGVVFADGKITLAERADLDTVVCLLGFDTSLVDRMISDVSQMKQSGPAETSNSLAGKSVCFTGTLCSTINGQSIQREHAFALVKSKGLVPVDSVTKKTNILVLADPNSMSGKAVKARSYGTRLLSDRVFWQELGIAID